jgi:hypothetical protein
VFTDAEIAYLLAQRLGRLATIQPGGTLQVSPVCDTFDPETGCFDVAGIEMASSQKFRSYAEGQTRGCMSTCAGFDAAVCFYAPGVLLKHQSLPWRKT